MKTKQINRVLFTLGLMAMVLFTACSYKSDMEVVNETKLSFVENETWKDLIARLKDPKITLDYKSKTSDFGGKNIKVESSYYNRMHEYREVILIFTVVDEKVTRINFGLTLFEPKKDYKDQMGATYDNGKWNVVAYRFSSSDLSPPETSNNPEKDLQTMYTLIKRKI